MPEIISAQDAAILHQAFDVAFATDQQEDPNADIASYYKKLRGMSTEDIKDIYSRSHRVTDLRGVPRYALITDVLRDRFGENRVEKFFKTAGRDAVEKEWPSDSFLNYCRAPITARRYWNNASNAKRENLSKQAKGDPKKLAKLVEEQTGWDADNPAEEGMAAGRRENAIREVEDGIRECDQKIAYYKDKRNFAEPGHDKFRIADSLAYYKKRKADLQAELKKLKLKGGRDAKEKVRWAVAWLKKGQWRTYQVVDNEDEAHQIVSELKSLGETATVQKARFLPVRGRDSTTRTTEEAIYHNWPQLVRDKLAQMIDNGGISPATNEADLYRYLSQAVPGAPETDVRLVIEEVMQNWQPVFDSAARDTTIKLESTWPDAPSFQAYLRKHNIKAKKLGKFGSGAGSGEYVEYTGNEKDLHAMKKEFFGGKDSLSKDATTIPSRREISNLYKPQKAKQAAPAALPKVTVAVNGQPLREFLGEEEGKEIQEFLSHEISGMRRTMYKDSLSASDKAILDAAIDRVDAEDVTPPGREKQVRALKKTGVNNPWAVSWASYEKSH